MDLQCEDFDNVVNRLRTFHTWPNSAPALIKDFVELGFVYTGENDKVVCYSCGLEYENWQDEDDPLLIHSSFSPLCSHLLEREKLLADSKLAEINSEEMPESALNFVGKTNPSNEISEAPVRKDSNDESLAKYEVRLGTFTTWPRESPSYIKDLVEAGFYYTGIGDSVSCFRCDIVLKDWSDNECPHSRHKQFSPSCEYICGETSQLSDKRKGSVEMKSIYKATNTPNVTADSNRESISNGTRVRPATMDRQLPGNIANDMCICDNRLQSFIDHPLRDPSIKYSDYASAGFYSMANGIDVLCFACQLSVGRCKDIFELDDVHKKRSPNCPFVQGLQCGNVASKNEKSGFVNCMRQWKEKEMCFFGRIGGAIKEAIGVNSEIHEDVSSGRASPAQLLGVPNSPKSLIRQRSNPTNRDYKTVSLRLQTFLTFPYDAVVQPSDLANAGFIYTGVEDGVKCYSCGVTLKNWEEGDTPWGEHIKWSSQCPLVLEHVNGSASHPGDVQCSSQPRNSLQASIDVSYNDDSMAGNFHDCSSSPATPSTPLTFSGRLPTNTTDNPSTPRQPQSKIQEKDYTQLLDMGFSREMIDKVQDIYLRLFGSLFLSPDELAQAIIYYQEFGSLNGITNPDNARNNINNSEQPTEMQASYEPNTEINANHKTLIEDENRSLNMKADATDLHNELKRVKEMQLCKICMDSEIGVVFIPCGHLITCPKCAKDIDTCPMCRAPIRDVVRTYMS